MWHMHGQLLVVPRASSGIADDIDPLPRVARVVAVESERVMWLHHIISILVIDLTADLLRFVGVFEDLTCRALEQLEAFAWIPVACLVVVRQVQRFGQDEESLLPLLASTARELCRPAAFDDVWTFCPRAFRSRLRFYCLEEVATGLAASSSCAGRVATRA